MVLVEKTVKLVYPVLLVRLDREVCQVNRYNSSKKTKTFRNIKIDRSTENRSNQKLQAYLVCLAQKDIEDSRAPTVQKVFIIQRA